MSMRFLLIVTVVLSGPMALAAAEEAPANVKMQSEYFFQAKKNQLVVNPSVDYSSQEGQYKVGSGGIKDAGPTYNFTFERGISENFAAALRVGYQNGTTELPGVSFDNQGLTDLRLTLKGSHMLNADAEILYGAYLQHSLGDKDIKMKFNKASPANPIPLSSDPESGGSSLNPYLGYQRHLGPSIVGARVIQTVFGTTRTSKVNISAAPIIIPERTLKEEGGGITDVAIFYERSIKKVNLGTAVSYRRVTEIFQTAPSRKRTDDAMQFFGVEVNPVVHLKGGKADLLGQVKYRSLLDADTLYNGQRLNAAQIIDVSIGGRFLF